MLFHTRYAKVKNRATDKKKEQAQPVYRRKRGTFQKMEGFFVPALSLFMEG